MFQATIKTRIDYARLLECAYPEANPNYIQAYGEGPNTLWDNFDYSGISYTYLTELNDIEAQDQMDLRSVDSIVHELVSKVFLPRNYRSEAFSFEGEDDTVEDPTNLFAHEEARDWAYLFIGNINLVTPKYAKAIADLRTKVKGLYDNLERTISNDRSYVGTPQTPIDMDTVLTHLTDYTRNVQTSDDPVTTLAQRLLDARNALSGLYEAWYNEFKGRMGL